VKWIPSEVVAIVLRMDVLHLCQLDAERGSPSLSPLALRGPTNNIDLESLWRRLVEGQSFFRGTFSSGGTSYAVIRELPERRPVPPVGVRVLERVLLGEQPKSIAAGLDCAVSTISVHVTSTLLGLSDESSASRASILLVMAVHAADGFVQPSVSVHAWRSGSELIVSAETPGRQFEPLLSPGEWQVARLCIEGMSHVQMALTRGTARRTVANQLASIYQKLRLSGRSALRAAAVRGGGAAAGGP